MSIRPEGTAAALTCSFPGSSAVNCGLLSGRPRHVPTELPSVWNSDHSSAAFSPSPGRGDVTGLLISHTPSTAKPWGPGCLRARLRHLSHGSPSRAWGTMCDWGHQQGLDELKLTEPFHCKGVSEAPTEPDYCGHQGYRGRPHGHRPPGSQCDSEAV